MYLQTTNPLGKPLIATTGTEFHFNFPSLALPSPESTQLDHLLDLDSRTALALAPQLELLQQNHPSWFQRYEDTPLESASSTELQELLQQAPNDFATGLVLGVFRARLFLSSITGQTF